MQRICFSMKKDVFNDREHSYVVDGWFRLKGMPSEDGRSCEVPREITSVSTIMDETLLGRVKVRKAIDWMFRKGSLWEEGPNYCVETMVQAPYIKVDAGTVRRMIGELTEDQAKAYLWARFRKSSSEKRGCRCVVAPIWLVRDLGLSEANGNRARVKRTLDELCETGWLEARPAQSGRMIEIVKVIDKQWDDLGKEWHEE